MRSADGLGESLDGVGADLVGYFPIVVVLVGAFLVVVFRLHEEHFGEQRGGMLFFEAFERFEVALFAHVEHAFLVDEAQAFEVGVE